jgi:CRP/FNR family transcriptional regulator
MEIKKYLCLHDIPFFTGLDRNSFRSICLATSKYFKKKGEFLFRQGDSANTIYIIKSGRFKLVKTTESGEEVIIQIVGSGEIIGETSLFREGVFVSVSAIAMEDAKACAISRQSFESIIRNEPNIALKIIKGLSDRLHDAWEQIAESNTQTIQEKVASLFIRLAQEYGESHVEGTIIKICLTQQEIASIVGASRVMISQVLGELTKRNYIYKKGKYYILREKCF